MCHFLDGLDIVYREVVKLFSTAFATRLATPALLAPLALVFAAPCASVERPVTAVTEPQKVTRSASTIDPCSIVTFDITCDAPGELRRRGGAEDGVVTCEAMCNSNETPHGPYQSVQFDEPPIVTTGAHHFGRRTGPWNVHETSTDGPIRETTTYLHGPRNGPYRTFHPNGAPHVTGAYKREAPHGRWTTMTVDGVLVLEQTFEDGNPVGMTTRRYPDGSRASEQQHDEAGRPDGVWTSWKPDGTVIDVAEFRDGTGIERTFDADGQLLTEQRYVDGELHGIGRVIEDHRTVETMWSHGKQTGLQREIVAGCVKTERTLVDGRAHGPFRKLSCGPKAFELQTGAYCGGHFCGLWVERSPRTGFITKITEYDALSMKLAEAKFDARKKLADFWTLDENLRLPRAACYQAIVGGLCCDPTTGTYTVNTDCLSAPDTTEL